VGDIRGFCLTAQDEKRCLLAQNSGILTNQKIQRISNRPLRGNRPQLTNQTTGAAAGQPQPLVGRLSGGPGGWTGRGPSCVFFT
jgi:hypothetical protein